MRAPTSSTDKRFGRENDCPTLFIEHQRAIAALPLHGQIRPQLLLSHLGRSPPWRRSRFTAEGLLEKHRAALSEAIHSSVVQAFEYPVEKKFHRFIMLDEADFIYPPDRSARYTIIEFSIFEGRSVEAKKLLIRLLYQRIPRLTNISPQDLEFTIFETPRHAWGIRGLPGDEIGLNYRVEV